METAAPILIYDSHLYHYAWCPQSLYHVNFSRLEMTPLSQLKATSKKSVNGNPYWVDKPAIQKMWGKTAEGEGLCEYMRVITESGEDGEIEYASLIYDLSNNVLFNVEKLLYRDGAWYPIIHVYKENDLWFKYAIVFTGMVVALRNNGFNASGGYLANNKKGDLGGLFTVTEEFTKYYQIVIEDIRIILGGVNPGKIQHGHCKFCCFENCPDAFKLVGVNRVENGFNIPLGDE